MADEQLKPHQQDKLINPDSAPMADQALVLRPENTPAHLHPLFGIYDFRPFSIEETDRSVDLTRDAWPGLVEDLGTDTLSHDLRARAMANARMCGAFEKASGRMVAYARILWGYNNLGEPQIINHMYAVHSSLRQTGIGEAVKWQIRQVALEFPNQPVLEAAETFDNLQGPNCHVNFNKLGMVCGASGGAFKADAYATDVQGEQHEGNPMDRYKGLWYLDSQWVLAKLAGKTRRITVEEAWSLDQAIAVEIDEKTGLLVPQKKVNLAHNSLWIAMAIPHDWDGLLARDKGRGFIVANKWREATRKVIPAYHKRGYTTILQVSDESRGVNLQIMRRGFNPFHPPAELLE
jgi:predicted GNAT superfamily acetyltransferase